MYISTGLKGLKIRLKKLGYDSYSDYLKSEHWQSFRKRFYRDSKIVIKQWKKYGYLVCDICQEEGRLNLHHKTYKRLGKERLGDVFMICNDCHKKIHIDKYIYKNLWKGTHDVRKKIKNHKI